jgi:hypothetical protein
MVVKYITPDGSRIHEPPYTKAEQAKNGRRAERARLHSVRLRFGSQYVCDA